MRYKITLSYNGAPFCGWQIQPNAPSVQQTVNEALSTLLSSSINVTGAGRTDTEVNALYYVAHFDYNSAIDAERLVYKLNAILPASIAVHSVEKVSDSFHARFDAKSREYTYYIHREKDPFANSFSYQYAYPGLDIDKMNEAASLLIGRKDFSCFEKTGADNRTSICEVTQASWTMDDSTHWSFHIAADRFLRNMVRAIVGTLLEVGRGKRTVEEFKALLENGTRCDAGESVPGRALFLSGIKY